MKRIDLPQKTVSELKSIFSAYPEIEKVIVFGSRALGNAKPGSDVDCAFSGKNLTSKLIGRIQIYLQEDTLFPYFFDCIHLEAVQSEDLLEHIKTNGINLYVSEPEK